MAREMITIECNISEEQYTILENSRLRKLICPFGVATAGTNQFAWTNLHYTATVVANLLDPAGTGKIEVGSKYDKLQKVISARGSGNIIGGGVSAKDE